VLALAMPAAGSAPPMLRMVGVMLDSLLNSEESIVDQSKKFHHFTHATSFVQNLHK
jgi:hypothetical protein